MRENFTDTRKLHKNLFLLSILIGMIFFAFLWINFSPEKLEAKESQAKIVELEKKIDAQKKRVEEIQNQTKIYETRIQEKHSLRATLSNQLGLLEDEMKKLDLEIDATKNQMETVNLEIEKLQKEITEKNALLLTKKDELGSMIHSISILEEKNILEMLLEHNQFSEIFSEIQNFQSVNQNIENVLTNILAEKEQLSAKILEEGERRRELENLNESLLRQEEQLKNQRGVKTALLTDTKNSESRFQMLLEEAKREQEKANSDIIALQREVQTKLEKLKKEEVLTQLSSDFIWPVPKNTITAYFHDPDYPYRYIFEHPAIDIRAGQGTKIKAAASGYVAQAKDAGYGYSYIMLVHNNNLATVYGHVSCILVETDSFVTKGQDIGCVGGLPGTRGAGRLTTGSHLHFEMRLNGIPVDPVPYLP